MFWWRGREYERWHYEQVANACESFVDLTPADQAPAQQVSDNWLALQPGQAVPLIWEDRYDREEERRAEGGFWEGRWRG